MGSAKFPARSHRATSTPAFRSAGSFFPDYVPASDPDFTFTVASGTSAFGFTPGGSDIIPRFKDNGSACNTGSSDTAEACWDGLSTTDKTIAQSSSANAPLGTATDVTFGAGIGTNRIQDAGSYSATVVLTATAL